MNNQPMPLWRLAWPIAVEMLLQFTMGIVDSVMVSELGDNHVSAVSVSNQIINSIMTVFFLVNAGAGIIVSRKWGEGSLIAVQKTATMAIKINAMLGLLFSFVLLGLSGPILQWINTPVEVLPYAVSYLEIVGGGMVVTILHMTLTTLIRGTGNTRATMYIAIGMNVLHLALNYLLIFGHLGMPELGLEGAAISTLASKCAALALCFAIAFRTMKLRAAWEAWRGYDRLLLKDMMSIGLPSIFTSMSWGVSQLFLIAIVSSLGAVPLAAYTYLNLIQQLPFTLGSAFGSAAQIQTAQYFGAKQYEKAYVSSYHGAWTGMLLSAVAALGAWLLGKELLRLFTSNPAVLSGALPIFVICILWQPMRIWTFTLTGGLNAVGEARFVAIISVIGMWFMTTAGAYLLGVYAGMGVIGIFLALVADELFRAVWAFIRWRQRRTLPAAYDSGVTVSAAP